ncbi:hypothetical protein [Brucella pituitosa]|uniref:hypothetical protein n=1 Tax=Brucella pituitosa TaxID=571256 RepID=UPI0012601D05|nr:hypothetical protein [Brucella pituitosa]
MMQATDNIILTPVSAITDTANVRVVLYANNRLIHAPLGEILKPLQDQINALTARVQTLEGR